MKSLKVLCCVLGVLLLLTACGQQESNLYDNAVKIMLNDGAVQVDGVPAGTDPSGAVYTAHDIVYYEAGKDFTYGEGEPGEEHTAEEAAAHTVVHITQPGTYHISGKLSKGQIAVDLGKDAKEDPSAVVTLILDGVDITCEVAPGVIFYNVYECADTDNPSKDVDTSAAGANVILADGSENTVRGSYVARIYKPESVVLNEAGTAVEDAKKLHKYDAAFYSKMSMNMDGGEKDTGILNIRAENEGLDSEVHLTINGGNIHITSGNDGINTNEDGVSVTTVNGGTLTIQVTGETGEGDGIDSNGWLVINGGTVIAAACSNSADAGIDSDMGIHINGGTVIATGHMLDHIEDGGQTYAVFNFAQKQTGAEVITLKNEAGDTVLEHGPKNAYSILVYSSPNLKEGNYTLWSDGQQLAGQGGGMAGGPGMGNGGMMPPGGGGNGQPPEGEPQPGGMQPPNGETMPGGQEPPEGGMPPAGQEPPEGEMPTGGQEPPEGENPPQRPGGPNGGTWNPNGDGGNLQERTPEFRINTGANMFSGIAPMTEATQ